MLLKTFEGKIDFCIIITIIIIVLFANLTYVSAMLPPRFLFFTLQHKDLTFQSANYNETTSNYHNITLFCISFYRENYLTV